MVGGAEEGGEAEAALRLLRAAAITCATTRARVQRGKTSFMAKSCSAVMGIWYHWLRYLLSLACRCRRSPGRIKSIIHMSTVVECCWERERERLSAVVKTHWPHLDTWYSNGWSEKSEGQVFAFENVLCWVLIVWTFIYVCHAFFGPLTGSVFPLKAVPPSQAFGLCTCFQGVLIH